MKDTYLEVTFRHGRPMAAYFYLPRKPGQRSYRTVEEEPGILVDYGRNGRPIGIEMTAPSRVSMAIMNRILRGSWTAATEARRLGAAARRITRTLRRLTIFPHPDASLTVRGSCA